MQHPLTYAHYGIESSLNNLWWSEGLAQWSQNISDVVFKFSIFTPLRIHEMYLRPLKFNNNKRHARKKNFVKLWGDYNSDATSEKVWSHCGLINKTKYSYRLDGQKWTSIASCKYSNFNARAITWNNLKFNMQLVCLTFINKFTVGLIPFWSRIDVNNLNTNTITI